MRRLVVFVARQSTVLEIVSGLAGLRGVLGLCA